MNCYPPSSPDSDNEASGNEERRTHLRPIGDIVIAANFHGDRLGEYEAKGQVGVQQASNKNMDIQPARLPRCDRLDGSSLRLISATRGTLLIEDAAGRRAVYVPAHHETLGDDVRIAPAYIEAGIFAEANQITVEDSHGGRVVCVPASTIEESDRPSKWSEHTIRLREGAVLSPEEINGLPEKLRRYIYELETRADPSGDIKQIASLTEQRDALVMKVKELEGELKRESHQW